MEPKIVTIANGTYGGVYSIANEWEWEYMLVKLEAHCLEHVYTKKRFLSFDAIPDGGIFTTVSSPVKYIYFRSETMDDFSCLTPLDHRDIYDDTRRFLEHNDEERSHCSPRAKPLRCLDLPADFFTQGGQGTRRKGGTRDDSWTTYLGEDHVEVVKVCSQLGKDYLMDGNHEEATKMRRKVLTIRLTLPGSSHRDVAAAYNNLGAALDLQGQHNEAEELHHKALSTLLGVIEERHSDQREG